MKACQTQVIALKTFKRP